MRKIFGKSMQVIITSFLLITGFGANNSVIAEEALTEPILNNGGFEEELDIEDIQTYKAVRVTKEEGQVLSGDYAIKVGSEKPEDESDVPMWFYNGGKGSVGLTARNITPDTEYKVTINVYNNSGVNMRVGVLDIEGSVPWGFESGRLGVSAEKIINNTEGWKEIELTIKSGPRTTELYIFALTEWTNTFSGAGDYYIDDVSIVNNGYIGSTAKETIAYNPERVIKNDFPETIPMVQNFEKSKELDSFNLDTNNQVIFTDFESFEKVQYFANKLVERGVITDYTLNFIDEDSKQYDGIVVVNKDVSFDQPEGFESTVRDSYEITIDKDKILVNAGYEEGVQNGLMTLLQAFSRQAYLPSGIVKDYTTQEIRGLQVDTGRRYYSMEWLEKQVEQMAYQKLNKLQLRLKDNEGIRYDSTVAPQFVDRIGGFWTQDEIYSLIDYAEKFNIEVIPEIDFPGHSEQDGEYFDDSWRLAPGGRTLDFSKQEVRDYMASIYEEAFNLFESDTVHMGGDEYFQTKLYDDPDKKLDKWAQEVTGNPNANDKDAFKLFFNEIAKPYLDAGKRVLMWNDNLYGINEDSVVELDKRIVIDYWSSGLYGSSRVNDALAAGYKVMGSPMPLYHDLWPENGKLDTPRPGVLHANWYKNSFGSAFGSVDIPFSNQMLGQMFPIWDDAHGYVPENILTRTLFPRLSVFSNVMWGGNRTKDKQNKLNYSNIERLIYQIGAVREEGFENINLEYTQYDVENISKQIKDSALKLYTEDNSIQEKYDALVSKISEIEMGNETNLRSGIISDAESGNDTRSRTAIVNELIHDYENLLHKEPTYGDVIVKYVDEDGNAIADDTVIVQPADPYTISEYNVSPKEIDGYSFLNLAENTDDEEGIFGRRERVVKYVYHDLAEKEVPQEPGKEVDPGEGTKPESEKPKAPATEKPDNKPGNVGKQDKSEHDTKDRVESKVEKVDNDKESKALPSTGMSQSNILVVASTILGIGLVIFGINEYRKRKNK